MRIGALARGRAAGCCAGVLLLAGLAGCSSTTSSTASVTGSTLTVYTSFPSADTDVFDAEKLALSQSGDKVGKFRVVLKMRPGNTTAEISQNARVAVSDSNTIAYLGESVPGTSGTSIQITNQVGILQVSPTDNALEFTQATPAVPDGLNHYYPSQSSNHYTFGRVVPSGAEEAKAIVSEMQAKGASKVYIANDGQVYGTAIADAVKQDVKAPMTTISGSPTPDLIRRSGADAVFVGTDNDALAAREFNAIASETPSMKMFGPSPLGSSAFSSALSASAQPETYISSPGVLPADAGSAAKTFDSSFRSAYGHAPAPQAVFGYEAMANLLKALRKAGVNAGNRADVVSAFTGLKDPGSATTPWQFVILHFKAGQLVPFKSVPATG
jgi:ABC-type branched-subunit amino acid transport system substrate-binding protein